MKKSLFRDCLNLARKKNTPDLHPQYDNFIHWTFIIQDDKIIEYGTNRCGSPPIHGYHEASKIHSEVDAWKKARGILKNDSFDVINIRLNKNNQLRNSKPCPCCYNFIKSVGARKIYYSTDIGFVKFVNTNDNL